MCRASLAHRRLEAALAYRRASQTCCSVGGGRGLYNCCCQVDTKACQLPKNPSAYELLLISSGIIKCITPPILRGGPMCKGVSRSWFTFAKFAFPCDEEVPFAISCCRYKCAEVVDGKLKFCGQLEQPTGKVQHPERTAHGP